MRGDPVSEASPVSAVGLASAAGPAGPGEAEGPGHRFAPGAGGSAAGGVVGRVPVPEPKAAVLPAGAGQTPLSCALGTARGRGAPSDRCEGREVREGHPQFQQGCGGSGSRVRTEGCCAGPASCVGQSRVRGKGRDSHPAEVC